MTKYYVIRHLKWLVIQSIMEINVVSKGGLKKVLKSHQWYQTINKQSQKGDLKKVTITSLFSITQKGVTITSIIKKRGLKKVLRLHKWCENLLIRRLKILVLIQKEESLRINNWSMKYTSSSPENFDKCKIFYFFGDNIWGADLSNVQLISKCKKGATTLM